MQAQEIKRLINSGKAVKITTYTVTGQNFKYKVGMNYYDQNGIWIDADFNTEDKVPFGDE